MEWSLPAFLYIAADEFLRIFFQHVVNFIQNGVDVLGQFLVALGDLGVGRSLDLVGLLARTCGALLPAGVPGGHAALRCLGWIVLSRSYPSGMTSEVTRT